MGLFFALSKFKANKKAIGTTIETFITKDGWFCLKTAVF